jgi:hypothetical protein
MKVIGTSNEGNPIVELDEQFREWMLRSLQVLDGIPVMTREAADRMQAQSGTDGGALISTVVAHREDTVIVDGKTLHRTATAPKAAPPATPARKGRQPRSRDKTCAICEAAFHDDSRTNTRKICAKPECRGEMERRSKHPDRKSASGEPKACAICGKPLTGMSPQAKTHKGACLKAYTRRQQQEWYRRQKQPTAPAPAVPPKVDHAERMRLIAEADRKVRERMGGQ